MFNGAIPKFFIIVAEESTGEPQVFMSSLGLQDGMCDFRMLELHGHTAASWHTSAIQVTNITICGYSREIEQPFLLDPDGVPLKAKIGDQRLQLSNADLRNMGTEASTITQLLRDCALFMSVMRRKLHAHNCNSPT
jgi:hypothetical protein